MKRIHRPQPPKATFYTDEKNPEGLRSQNRLRIRDYSALTKRDKGL